MTEIEMQENTLADEKVKLLATSLDIDLEIMKKSCKHGFTSTLKRIGNADTYKYFGAFVYKYSLKEGMQDGFFILFKVKHIFDDFQTHLDA